MKTLWRRARTLPVGRDDAERIGRNHITSQGLTVNEPVAVTRKRKDTWLVVTNANSKHNLTFIWIDGITGEIKRTEEW